MKKIEINGQVQEVKEMEDWKTCISVDFKPGDYFDREIAWELITAVPPATWTGEYFQCGEPFSHRKDENGCLRMTYLTLVKVSQDPEVWEYKGDCFIGIKNYKNRGKHMILDNIFNQIKENGYVEDKTYNVCDISEATGLQKQPDGSWKPPKKSAKSQAGKDPVHAAEHKQLAISKMTPEHRAAVESGKTYRYADKNGVSDITKEDLAEAKKDWEDSGFSFESGSAEAGVSNLKKEADRYILSGAANKSSKDKFLHALNVELDERFGDINGNPADIRSYVENWVDRNKENGGIGFKNSHNDKEPVDSISSSEIDEAMSDKKAVDKIISKWEKFYGNTGDAAPKRVLTGDTMIRVRAATTEDKRYNVGDISEATGKQKQPDGSWKFPKNGMKGHKAGDKVDNERDFPVNSKVEKSNPQHLYTFKKGGRVVGIKANSEGEAIAALREKGVKVKSSDSVGNGKRTQTPAPSINLNGKTGMEKVKIIYDAVKEKKPKYAVKRYKDAYGEQREIVCELKLTTVKGQECYIDKTGNSLGLYKTEELKTNKNGNIELNYKTDSGRPMTVEFTSTPPANAVHSKAVIPGAVSVPSSEALLTHLV